MVSLVVPRSLGRDRKSSHRMVVGLSTIVLVLCVIALSAKPNTARRSCK